MPRGNLEGARAERLSDSWSPGFLLRLTFTAATRRKTNANNTATFAGPNEHRARISFQPKTGLFSGQFKTTAGKLRRFHGVCVQLPDSLNPGAFSIFGEENRSVVIAPAD